MAKKFSVRYLKSSHIVVLALIALLALAGQVIVQYSLSKQVNDPQVINIAGRQRMLSQKLSKASLLAVQMFNNQEKRWSYLKELEEALELWEESYRALRGRSTKIELRASNSAQILELYVDTEPQFEAILSASRKLIDVLTKSEDASGSSDEYLQQIISQEDIFLKKMDRIVQRYAQEAEERTERLQQIELTIFGLICLSLVICYLFILKPIEDETFKAVNQLQEGKDRAENERSEAENSAKLKNDFMATLSHGIRTPMNGILGMSNLLLDTPLTDEQSDYANSINKSADSIITIVNDIQDLSRIEKSSLSVDTISFDLRLLLEDILESLSVRAEDKGLELLLQYSLDLPQYFVSDPNRIRQIISNLVSNAIEFSPKGHVIVKVAIDTVDEYKANLKIDVTDSGAEGTNSAQPVKVANQQEQEFKANLGLVVAKQIAELLQGEISVENEKYGEGSCFVFKVTLPYNKSRSKPVLFEQKEVHLLILDDDQLTQEFLQSTLDDFGINCYGCLTPQEVFNGLRNLKSGKAIVLFKNDLPGLQLEEFVEKLQEQNANSIMMSHPRKMTEARKFLNEKKLKSVVLKPLRIIRLIEAIGEAADEQNKSRDKTSVSAQNGPRVLVVEDNIVNLKVAVCMLEKLGCKVDKAENGLQAIESYKQGTYDVIFMDCQMPEMDGFEAAKTIRGFEAQSDKHTPIVAMTANVMQKDRDRCFEVGMDGFIAKPIDTQDLKDALKYFANPAKHPQLIEDETVLSYEVLERLRSLQDESFLRDLFQTFINNTKEGLQQINKAVEEGDLSKLKSAAQKLKGSSKDIGARRIAEICQDLEGISDLGSFNKLNAFVSAGQLSKEFEKVKATIQNNALSESVN